MARRKNLEISLGEDGLGVKIAKLLLFGNYNGEQ
jgi:hypothetical protein